MSDPLRDEEFGWNERRLPQRRAANDHRPYWERDRSRVIHSAAFRRLQAKTQVLGVGESDFHRTRLTHTMEVAQIGRGIVLELEAKGADTPYASVLPHTAQIEAICFAHDLGHPPFGHSGEIALNFAMHQEGGFEGNGQSLRIVSRLEPHSLGESTNSITGEFALNLTRRTLLGILKYPAPYSRVTRRVPPTIERFPTLEWKPPKCYMDSEQDIVDWVLSLLSAEDRELFRSLEKEPTDEKSGRTQYKSFDSSLLELADDIAYGIHDLEDAISLKLISWEEFQSIGEESLEWARDCDEHNNDLHGQLFGIDARKGTRKLTIGSFIRQLVSSVEVFERREFQSPLLRYCARLAAPARKFLDNVQNQLIQEQVIKSQEVQTLEFRGRQIASELFVAFMSDPERLLGDTSRKRLKSTPRARVVCDYIAGMTDLFATRFYERLFGTRQASVFEKL